MGTAELKQPGQEPASAESPLGSGQHEKEEFAKHLFETVREPLLALNSDLKVWLANQSFYRCFRVSQDETIGRYIYDLGNGQWNIPQLRRLLEEIIPKNETFDDFQVDHDFERIGKKSMLLNARRFNNGRLILLAIEDVTERRRMETDLRFFAHMASHDLKEPLRMVASYLVLLMRQADRHDEKSEKYIELAADGARRMRTLIDNLLAHSSVGKQTGNHPVDFNVVFENVSADLKLSLSEANARVDKGDLPKIMGDSTEFEQLLQNILSNAIKYRGKESPRVHVSAERQGAAWLFKVEDNGMGIAASDLSRIFEPFQRLHARSEYPGTGLGLSTCRKIVESHGGRIWVDSEPGRGSTFYFTLPAIAA